MAWSLVAMGPGHWKVSDPLNADQQNPPDQRIKYHHDHECAALGKQSYYTSMHYVLDAYQRLGMDWSYFHKIHGGLSLILTDLQKIHGYFNTLSCHISGIGGNFITRMRYKHLFIVAVNLDGSDHNDTLLVLKGRFQIL